MKRDPVVILVIVVWVIIILCVIGLIIYAHAISNIPFYGDPAPSSGCIDGNLERAQELGDFRILDDVQVITIKSVSTLRACIIYANFNIPSNSLDRFLETTDVITPLEATTRLDIFENSGSHGWVFDDDVTYLYGEASSQYIAVDIRNPNLYQVYLIRFLD